MGNGGAMRVGPVGAYFADDLAAVVEHAGLSAVVTHAHPEGQAGAIAAAVATACAAGLKGNLKADSGRRLIETVIEHAPDGKTRDGLVESLRIDPASDVRTAARALGNGSEVTAPDTVPLAVWCAARHLDDFEEAMWATVSAWGDIDTNCAIVGSIVAMTVGLEGIPAEWIAAREPLPLKGGG
jgi:ADP-ribosylglycohydrolase